MKTLFFSLLISLPLTLSAQISGECDSDTEILLGQPSFVQTPFGKAATRIEASEALGIVKLIQDLKSSSPDKNITRVEVLVCTSDVKIKPESITDRRENIHIELAQQRAAALKKELNKASIQSDISSQVCGPSFVKKDLNWRFFTEENSKKFYDSAFATLNTPESLEMYKEFALIENFEELKRKFPAPYLAKYKPFNGYRIKVFAKNVCRNGSMRPKPKSPSGKNQ